MTAISATPNLHRLFASEAEHRHSLARAQGPTEELEQEHQRSRRGSAANIPSWMACAAQSSDRPDPLPNHWPGFLTWEPPVLCCGACKGSGLHPNARGGNGRRQISERVQRAKKRRSAARAKCKDCEGRGYLWIDARPAPENAPERHDTAPPVLDSIWQLKRARARLSPQAVAVGEAWFTPAAIECRPSLAPLIPVIPSGRWAYALHRARHAPKLAAELQTLAQIEAREALASAEREAHEACFTEGIATPALVEGFEPELPAARSVAA